MDMMEGAHYRMAPESVLSLPKDSLRSSHANSTFQIQNIGVIQIQLNNQHTQKPDQFKVFTGCANKLCKNHQQCNKKQNLQICLETLCSRCQDQFQKDSFCIYCKQIYFDETDDGKEWIMCEECARWVHSLCADFNTKENPNAQFQCIKCRKIESQPNGRRVIPRAGYAKLEKKKNYEFLNSIGFQWQLATHEMSQDMERIRKYLN